MQISKSNTYLLVGIFLIAILTLFPFLYYQGDVTLRIHDNMDSNIVWVKMLIDNNACWVAPDTIVEQLMGGVPRSSLSSTYDLPLLIFWTFGIFWGYAINKLLLAVIGFVGMYLLLKKHLLPKTAPIYIPLLVAFLFGSSYFWSFSATVAGVPLAFWAFLNLRKGDARLVNWLALILYGIDSSLVLTGFFVLLAMTIVFLYDWIRKRNFNTYLFAGLALLSITYILTHFPIFYSHLIPSAGYISHRTEMQMMGNQEMGLYYFWYALQRGGPSHLIIMQIPIILPLACFMLGLMLYKKQINRNFIITFSAILFSTVLVTILNLTEVNSVMTEVYTKTIPLDLARVQWLTPMLWYVLFALSLAVLLKYYPKTKYFVLILIVLQFANIKRPTSSYRKDSNSPLTYNQYYSPKQFDEVKGLIGQDQKDYRVISVGLAPAVAQFNGFYTIDGYLADYPLQHKHDFQEVIQGEINKSGYIHHLFVNWGSCCYAYSADLLAANSTGIENNLPKVNLDYNFEKLKQMAQGKDIYIISAVEIDNDELELLSTFAQDDWYWNIRLYKVK